MISIYSVISSDTCSSAINKQLSRPHESNMVNMWIAPKSTRKLENKYFSELHLWICKRSTVSAPILWSDNHMITIPTNKAEQSRSTENIFRWAMYQKSHIFTHTSHETDKASDKSVQSNTFSTRWLPSCDVKNLGGHPHRSLDPKTLVFCPTHQIRAHWQTKASLLDET